MQYFNPSDFVLFRTSTLYFRKLIKKWQKFFLINSFGRYHGTSYSIKILDGKLASSIHQSDYLQIFCLQEGYLCPTNKKPLKII